MRGWEGSCGGGVRDGALYQADRLEITREKGDAASGSGEYAFWITGGCPWEGCLVVCRARLVSLRSSLVTSSNETEIRPHSIPWYTIKMTSRCF